MNVRSHFDVLVWLQGNMQRYLPHDIMIAAWGDFNVGKIRHDVISGLAGVRSQNSNPDTITPLLRQLFTRWIEFGKKPFSINADESGFLLEDRSLKSTLGDAMRTMRCSMVHGIHDKRDHGNHDCLYVAFSAQRNFSEAVHGAMASVMPYIDAALRQVEHLPHQAPAQTDTSPAPNTQLTQVLDLTEREAEVLFWVALGKTNTEIGSILSISSFTVKNHMHQVFKKLDVSNRAQAVGKLNVLASHAPQVAHFGGLRA